jgi:sialate O-acetylesterase
MLKVIPSSSGRLAKGIMTFVSTLALLQVSSKADVKLATLFSDNAVLQRGKPVPVWGWADEGEKVTVEFQKQKVSTVSKDGKWRVQLKSLKVGEPGVLKVSGKNTIELQNVAVGEVWICSGQSNMEWPLSRAFESQAAINSSANPNLRLFTVPKLKANSPVADVKGSWQEASAQSVPAFSAVAYYFGRDLQKALGVPVGLIHTSWGGSPVEVWMSQDVLEKNPGYKSEILDEYESQVVKSREALAKWQQEEADLKKEGKRQTKPRPGPGWKPAELYNGMIAPLVPYAIAGAIWYQGESNAGRAYQYRTLFADMITNWRTDWHQGSFPFLLVQLAPWDKGKKRSIEEITKTPGDSDWAELREAQNLSAEKLPNVGVAVITDVGDKDDIHPTKKEPVGARLALAARKIAYRENIESSGPVFKKITVKGDKAVVSFSHAKGGLEQRGPKLSGFAIAGEDRKWVWADATVDGEKVILSNPEVAHPVAVRYGWADYPVVNLWNKAGLPASPFRTDDFPMLTKKK